jgi:hypothetical protein
MCASEAETWFPLGKKAQVKEGSGFIGRLKLDFGDDAQHRRVMKRVKEWAGDAVRVDLQMLSKTGGRCMMR